MAYRLTDKMSLRAGYGLYFVPFNLGAQDQFGVPYYGFGNYTDAPPTVQGVPQMQLSNPFTSAFPVVPAYGKFYGAYTGLGDAITFFNPTRFHPASHRVNISLQRQLPDGIVLDVTYFQNWSTHANSARMT